MQSSKIIVSLVDKETEEVSRALFEKLLSKEGVSDLGGNPLITDKVQKFVFDSIRFGNHYSDLNI